MLHQTHTREKSHKKLLEDMDMREEVLLTPTRKGGKAFSTIGGVPDRNSITSYSKDTN